MLRNHDTFFFLGSKSTYSVDQDLSVPWLSCWLPEASFLHCLFLLTNRHQTDVSWDQKASELTTEGEDQEADTIGLKVSDS